jgi:hypothetical protein
MAPSSSEPVRPIESDRELALARIQQAFAEGHLSHEDLEDHLQSVLTASTSDALVLAVDSLPVPDPGREVSVTAMNGTIRRTGPWRVPRRLRIESENGSVRLDFSGAVFEAPIVDVELQLRFGRARIIVPAEAIVDLEGLQTVWKQPRYTPPRRTSGTGPLIRLYGSMEYGRLRIRHRRP